MDIEQEFETLNMLIQNIYEFMDVRKLNEALYQLEKIRKEVVGK